MIKNSFSQLQFWVQPALQSPTKNSSSLQSNFISLFHPYFLTSSSLQFSLTLPYLSNSSSPSFCVQPTIPAIFNKNIFSTSANYPEAMESCEERHCFNLFLRSESINSDNEAHNQWFLLLRLKKLVYCR